jgi:ribosomal protein RSM22 (predicted rRNA methylase)
VGDRIEEQIEQLLYKVPKNRLEKAFLTLQARYRERSLDFRLESLDEHLAYLLLRMPATYKASLVVLLELQKRVPEFTPKRLIDLGAGPGSATLAAHAIWNIQESTCVEQNPIFISLAKELLPRSVHFRNLDARKFTPPAVDLAVASYSLGEFSKDEAEGELRKYLSNSAYTVIIEPGTPRGYERILQLRSFAIEQGYHVLAPCPHAKCCPMAPASKEVKEVFIAQPRWCHFSTRIQRSSLQRQVKAGTTSYEDEKYCYLIISQKPHQSLCSRIVQTPQVTPGYVDVELCTANGTLQRERILKRDGGGYKQARKLEWGDCIDLGKFKQ